ncbi:MAG: bifunctional (p)ppGpp synthetase/guanosine-3',5'-bis(diphosphate) 3'-pyrophosphohydrolase [Oscillospiraceae bacterium]|nr:bifunctional (p)ppGpp synthetase/guanosine-3',5'-bis(diphosphate) 3'-pyrophosphohydrolase [Candidatus Limimonas egerieequi]
MSEYDDRYSELEELLLTQYSEEEADKINEAYKFAKKAHSGQCRYSGEPYIMHPVAVAKILFDLGMDYESLIAALLHDTVEDTETGLDNISELFGKDVANLVDGVTKLGKVPLETKEERQAENIRKMFIAMSEDIRVVIIKLADRLHNMRTLEYMRDQKRRDKAQETLEIYAPIAHRLGIRTVKEELEDLAIRYLDPVGYNEIDDLVKRNDKVHPNFIPDTIERIGSRVKEVVPNARIDGRRKSVHGIYHKMYVQNREFDEIYDVYAIRIIVNDVVECYNCLGIIHDMYHSLPGRFKDYISTPKSNMYQSLHTTVISSEGIPFEVQIRTFEMHQTAEYGIAAHWKYKLGVEGKGNDNFEERLVWIRQLLENQKDSDDVEDLVRTIKSDFVPDDVFVFTPKGDVINIPYGSTVIDFAYAIHTQVGHKMTGAKVDGRIVPIDYKVQTGQIVEILRSPDPNKGPSRDWLNIVTTASARTKIRGWFKKEKRPENIEEGKIQFERELRKNNIRLFDEEYDLLVMNLAKRKAIDNSDDFFAAIGYGSISLEKLNPFIKDEYQKILKASETPRDEIKVTKPIHRTSSEGIIVEGIDNCLVKLSRCCNPLPGDEIIGFVTRGHGVSVHKRDCTNVPIKIADALEPERWINVYWDENVKEEFNATLDIYCINRIGLMADISTTLANMHVDIRSIATHDTKDGSRLTLTIAVNGVEHLHNVIKFLRKINGVLTIERTGV